MTDRIKKALGDLKARQDTGEHMPCPRCGWDTMKENIHTNALSRHADIYICDACGMAEALLKVMSNRLSVAKQHPAVSYHPTIVPAHHACPL